MEVKKNKKVNIEKTRGIYFQLGLVIVLSLSLIAFEWSSGLTGPSDYEIAGGQTIDDDIIPITTIEEEPPVVKPPLPNFSDIIKVFENDVVIDTKVDIDDMFTMDEEIPIQIYEIEDEPEEKEQVPFIIVEDMPTFKGGDENTFARWVQRNVRYPQVPAENGIQGRVFVEFVVEPDGTVSNVSVIKGVHPALDAEAVRVISNSPKWVAGRQMGVPVRVRFAVSVKFELRK